MRTHPVFLSCIATLTIHHVHGSPKWFPLDSSAVDDDGPKYQHDADAPIFDEWFQRDYPEYNPTDGKFSLPHIKPNAVPRRNRWDSLDSDGDFYHDGSDVDRGRSWRHRRRGDRGMKEVDERDTGKYEKAEEKHHTPYIHEKYPQVEARVEEGTRREGNEREKHRAHKIPPPPRVKVADDRPSKPVREEERAEKAKQPVVVNSKSVDAKKPVTPKKQGNAVGQSAAKAPTLAPSMTTGPIAPQQKLAQSIGNQRKSAGGRDQNGVPFDHCVVWATIAVGLVTLLA